MTEILVTGGAGFIGSHLVDRLIDTGYDVTVLDNLTDQVHDGEPGYLNPDAEYVWGDVRDRDLLADLLADADVLSHQASAVGIGQSMYEIEHYVEVNSLGTARILDVLANEDVDLEKLVVASSFSPYGEGRYRCPDCDDTHYPTTRSAEQMERGEWEHRCPDCETALEPVPTTEAAPLDNRNVYALTKKDQEQLCRSIGEAYDIPTVALRYFNVYGSRQSLDNPYTGVCAIFSSRIKNDNPPKVFEDGYQTRDFIHVSDVARANVAAIEADVDDAAVNVGTGKPKTIRDVANTLIALYGKQGSLDPEISDDFRAGDVRHCFADTSAAEELLNFEPEVGFEAGMRELVRWGQERSASDNFEEAYSELESKGLLEE